MRKLVAVALFGLSAMRAGPAASAPADVAHASEEFSDFSLEFTAAPACPARAEFEAALLSRAPAARLREAGTGTLALAVTLTADGAAYSGVLAITLPNGARSERTVADASCREASLSLAVIASLVLEAYRQHQALPAEPNSVNDAEPNAEAAESAPAPPTNEAAPAPAAPPRPPAAAPIAPATPPRDAASEREPARRSRLKWGIFGALSLETAVAASPPLGGLAGVHGERRGDGIWSPEARLGVLFTANGSSSADAGDAELRLLAARLDLCPVRFAATRALALVPCVELDAGSLRGGSNAPNASVRHMPWLALGGGLRAEWALGELVSLEAFASGRRLSRHDRFVLVAPNDPSLSALLYDVPAWSAGVGLGASLRLP